MALAWVQLSEKNNEPVFQIETGSNDFFDLFVTTRPELMRPDMSAQRSAENFFSSRAAGGRPVLSKEGKAIFPLPGIFSQRYPNSKLFYMVKTYRDKDGNGPALSPVMQGNHTQVVMDPIDPTEESMNNIDYEASLAGFAERRAAVQTSSKSVRPRSRGQSARRRSKPRPGRQQSKDKQQPLKAASSNGSTHDLALGLAYLAEHVRASSAADPRIPGKPSYRDVVRVLSYTLSQVPADGYAAHVSAASVANGVMRNHSRPVGGARELEASIMRASRQLGVNYSREAAFPLIPLLISVLPSLIPMITQLLQGVAKSKSATVQGLGQRYSRESAFPAALIPILINALPAILPIITQLLQGLAQPRAAGYVPGLTETAAPAAGAQNPGASAAAAAQLLAQIGGQAAPAAAPAAGGTTPAAAPGTAAAAPSPEQITQLLGSLQGAGGGGLGGLLMPGTPDQLLKSVVDRLPIEKMFDGQAWIPQINHDQFVSTLPWDKVLSLSEPAAVVSTIAVPGRDKLKPLPGAGLELVNIKPLEIGEGQKSWVFRSDKPARFKVRVSAGPEGVEQPFLDVRVSSGGTAASGLHRSVFRLRSLKPDQEGLTAIEIPQTIWQQARTQAAPYCLSIRLVERSGEQYRALEKRACFYVVQPHTFLVDAQAAVHPAPELAALPGLSLTIPKAHLSDTGQLLSWATTIERSDALADIAYYVPVEQRKVGEETALSGGLQISTVGLVDLLKYKGDISAEQRNDLTAAIDGDPLLRGRMALAVREYLDGAVVAQAREGISVRVQMGWMPGYLVSFSGSNAAGNPTGRAVRPVHLPVPLGIEIDPV